MQDLDQIEKEQVDVQMGQDISHLVSHQLLNSAGKLQMIYNLWSEPEALSAPQNAEVFRIFQQEVNFLHRLGQYILHLDLASSKELLLNFKSVDMIDLIKQMLPSFQLQGPKRDFENHHEADLPLIWGDAARLRDVLNNLVSNALKYSTPFSPIIISTHRDNDQVRVSVTNAGPTIPAGGEERIFTRFYRGHGHQQAGYGLGLYLAHHLVEQHGGRMWVESSTTAVTTFHFTLLLAPQGQLVSPFRSEADLFSDADLVLTPAVQNGATVK